MDKLDKFLSKLNRKESALVMTAISDILSQRTAGYNIKKLKGFRDIYRVRIGTLRIIYRQGNNTCELLDISRRSETTYKNF